MSVEMPPPGRGSSESAAYFRAALAQLGMSMADLVRALKRLGDDRNERTIRRSLERMAAGDSRVSGEMRALLTVLSQSRDAGAPPP